MDLGADIIQTDWPSLLAPYRARQAPVQAGAGDTIK
jgi:hypothetical protein